MTDIERIRKAIDWLIFENKVKTRRELAENLGYTESSLSQILNEKVSLSEKFIKKLSNFDKSLNRDWLLYEKGEMINNIIEPKAIDFSIALDKAIDEIGAQRKLTEKAQEQIDRLITIIEKSNI